MLMIYLVSYFKLLCNNNENWNEMDDSLKMIAKMFAMYTIITKV